jgi:hypothetical protein
VGDRTRRIATKGQQHEESQAAKNLVVEHKGAGCGRCYFGPYCFVLELFDLGCNSAYPHPMRDAVNYQEFRSRHSCKSQFFRLRYTVTAAAAQSAPEKTDTFGVRLIHINRQPDFFFVNRGCRQ